MIDGRWLMDFGGVGNPDPTGNELILADGKVAVAKTGAPIGTYEVRDELLEITVNLPMAAGEPLGQLVAKVLLPDPGEDSPRLPGIVEAVHGDEPARVMGTCFLVRRATDARRTPSHRLTYSGSPSRNAAIF